MTVQLGSMIWRIGYRDNFKVPIQRANEDKQGSSNDCEFQCVKKSPNLALMMKLNAFFY